MLTLSWLDGERGGGESAPPPPLYFFLPGAKYVALIAKSSSYISQIYIADTLPCLQKKTYMADGSTLSAVQFSRQLNQKCLKLALKLLMHHNKLKNVNLGVLIDNLVEVLGTQFHWTRLKKFVQKHNIMLYNFVCALSLRQLPPPHNLCYSIIGQPFQG